MDWNFCNKIVDDTFDRIKTEAEKNQVCLRKACGCAILRFEEDGSVTATQAINGPSHPNNECTNEVGNCGCSHAEPRAILKFAELGRNDCPVILLTTYSSCIPCANLVIECGFIDVVAYEIWAPHWARADVILKNVIPVWTREIITPNLLSTQFEK